MRDKDAQLMMEALCVKDGQPLNEFGEDVNFTRKKCVYVDLANGTSWIITNDVEKWIRGTERIEGVNAKGEDGETVVYRAGKYLVVCA